MNKDIIINIPFFQEKPASFIAYLGPFLKPIKVNKYDYIFMEGDPADESFVFSLLNYLINTKINLSVFHKIWKNISCFT